MNPRHFTIACAQQIALVEYFLSLNELRSPLPAAPSEPNNVSLERISQVSGLPLEFLESTKAQILIANWSKALGVCAFTGQDIEGRVDHTTFRGTVALGTVESGDQGIEIDTPAVVPPLQERGWIGALASRQGQGSTKNTSPLV
jgi:hypothetical protein